MSNLFLLLVPTQGGPTASQAMYGHFAFVIAFTIFSILFVVASVAVISRILRPRIQDPVKELTYECGEPVIGSSWVRFDIRFYTVAIVFLLFEVEVAFLFPWALVFKDLLGADAKAFGAPFVFVEAAIFLIILAVALVFVWAKGDLDWVKTMEGTRERDRQRAAGTRAPAETAAQKG